MKFFAIDQHISVIADIKQVFGKLGHQVDDLCLSGHHWVMKREKDSVPGLDGDQWCGMIQREFWNKFHEDWHEKLDKYDGFICCYPPLFAYLYKNFDKPIIIQIPIRYEYPCHQDKEAWTNFNTYLQNGVDDGKIFLCANNPYDQRYAELFLGRTVRFIPSLCEYTEAHWMPKTRHCLYYHWNKIADLDPSVFLRKYEILKQGHTWDDLQPWKAIVHFPYNVSTMSIMEHYSAGIPLLFPSKEFALELYKHKFRMFEQSTWVGTYGKEAGSVIVPDGGFPNGYDPNDYANIDAVSYWLNYADFYCKESMQGLRFFSSIDELHELAAQPVEYFKAQAWEQNRFYEKRKTRAYTEWSRLLGELSL